MARFEQINDVYFTEGGDYFLGTNGDLADTQNDAYRGFIQRVDTRMKSSKRDWATQPRIGVGLGQFVGRANTEDTARAIRSAVYTELYQDDLLRASELMVDVVPMSTNRVLIVLIIKPPGTTGQLVMTYSYDLRDNKIMNRSN